MSDLLARSFDILWTSLRRNLSEDRENYNQSQTRTWKSTEKVGKTTNKVCQNYKLGGQKKLKENKFLENFAWFTFGVARGQNRTFEGKQPLTEDDLWQKTTFDGRRPLTEDYLWRKTTIGGRRPLSEDNLWRKRTFDRRQPLTEDDLWRKTTFDGRRPLTEDDL